MAEMKAANRLVALVVVALVCLVGLGLAVTASEDISNALSLVNEARQAQGIEPLSWDGNLAAYAQYWADAMASGQQRFAHATGQYRPSQGENLYERASGQCDFAYENPVQTAMRSWLGQAPLYNNEPIATGNEPWLHWSQCMWSNTTQIGCARAFSISEAYKVYDVCRFYPQGNIIGEKPF